MNRKKILTSLAILHVCIFLLCILIIRYFSSDEPAATASNEITIPVTQPETVIEVKESSTYIESESESQIESETASEVITLPVSEPETQAETEIETITEPESDTIIDTAVEENIQDNFPSYTFIYYGDKRLNIRKEPSLESEIIGKIPSGNTGLVIGMPNDDWVEITYGSVKGYCYKKCIITYQK